MPSDFLTSAISWLNNPQVQQTLAPDLYHRLFGRVFGTPVTDGETISRLLDVPGEVSERERFFLYNFISTVWSGSKPILELGPFLGASTKAIALGMLANPRFNHNVKFYTYDRFGAYYKPQPLLKKLEPLTSRGALSDTLVSKLQAADETSLPDFLEIFNEIHSGEDYWNILEVARSSLPGTRQREAETDNIFVADPSMEFEILFIDGCKSWYGTKYFMLEMCKCTKPGAFFLSQDYGWKSCFWLPAFWYVMKDCFQLVANLDTTYMFQLVKPLDPERINSTFPDDPEQYSAEDYGKIFNLTIQEAANRCDMHGLVTAYLQHVAALAYIGEKELARKILVQLEREPFTKMNPYARWIKQSFDAPTYYPDGPNVTL
ncbi:MAG: hypothetical protein KDD66_05400 [Bdellovibrionales bacterium]|nr:hypothetical protein [Bdellovibrionales bacterium]